MKIKIMVLLLVGLFFILGCTVNSTTGAIIVRNLSDIDAKNIKVGTLNIGNVDKGATTTYYFIAEELSAQISADGFDAPGLTDGQIDLKLNYSYDLRLILSNGEYYFNCTGTKAGGDAADSSYTVNME